MDLLRSELRKSRWAEVDLGRAANESFRVLLLLLRLIRRRDGCALATAQTYLIIAGCQRVPALWKGMECK